MKTKPKPIKRLGCNVIYERSSNSELKTFSVLRSCWSSEEECVERELQLCKLMIPMGFLVWKIGSYSWLWGQQLQWLSLRGESMVVESVISFTPQFINRGLPCCYARILRYQRCLSPVREIKMSVRAIKSAVETKL